MQVQDEFALGDPKKNSQLLAYAKLIGYAARNPGVVVSAADLFPDYGELGMKDGRALGPVMREAARHGVIKHLGWAPTKRELGNRGPASVYEIQPVRLWSKEAEKTKPGFAR